MTCSIASLIGYILATTALVGLALYAGFQGIWGWVSGFALALGAQGTLYLVAGVISSCRQSASGTGTSSCPTTNMDNTITALRVVLGIAITGYGTAALVFWDIFHGGPGAAFVAATSAEVACGVALALLVSLLAFAFAYQQCLNSLMGTGTGRGAGAGAAKKQGDQAGAKAKRSTTSLLRSLEVLNDVPIGQWDMGVMIELHRRLLPPTHPSLGQLRTHPGVVLLNGKVLRKLPPASESVSMANAALRRLNAVPEETREIDWISVAAETMLRLLEAHPFKDGNGRVSRAVTTWLLMRGGYEVTSNPDFYCRQHVGPYYRALIEAMKGQRSTRDEAQRNGCELWDQFFGRMIQACFKASVSR